MLQVEFAERSNPGSSRVQNEDCVGHVIPVSIGQAHDDGWLFALADGVGGQDRGEVASRLAIDTVLAEFRAIPKGVMHVSLLPKLVQQANQVVFEAGDKPTGEMDENRGRKGGSRMASTLILCALRFDSAVISHVGDSRCYLFRSGKLNCLTHDHTMASEQFRIGVIDKEDQDTLPNRHILTRCLGMELFVAADTITVPVIPGDILMLCSDGLHGYVPDSAIQAALASTANLDEAASALIAAANEEGGHDNVSVQLIRVRSVERMGLYRGRPYRLL